MIGSFGVAVRAPHLDPAPGISRCSFDLVPKINLFGSSGIIVGEKSYIASDFLVLVLSEAVLSATVLVLDGCLNCRCRWLIEAVHGNLQTTWVNR
jgi:hypothetical protein